MKWRLCSRILKSFFGASWTLVDNLAIDDVFTSVNLTSDFLITPLAKFSGDFSYSLKF